MDSSAQQLEKARAGLINMKELYEARVDIFTNAADCAESLYDRVCACLSQIEAFHHPPVDGVGAAIRTSPTGATRSLDADKIDPEACFSPIVVLRFAQYMHKHQTLADGSKRASDDWQKGQPVEWYMKSLCRHLLDVWLCHRDCRAIARSAISDALCGVIFNAMGYLHEVEKARLGEIEDRVIDELLGGE